MVINDIETYIKQLGSTSPTPGGGSAAALSLSLGAACAEKAARFSLKEESEKDFSSEFASLKDIGLQLSDDDQIYFKKWQESRQLPKNTEEEKEIRKKEVTRYAEKCAITPLTIGMNSIKLAETIEEFLPHCNKFLISDAACGISHAASAFESSIFNIMINLPYVKNNKLLNELKNFLNDYTDYINDLKEKIYSNCEEILKS